MLESFRIIQDFAISPSERLAVVGGRIEHANHDGRTDGIFLMDIRSGTITWAAPYLVGATPGVAFGTLVRCLNVSDRGTLLYEDNGVIVPIDWGQDGITSGDRPAGRFPVLMPDGSGYVYYDGVRILWTDRKIKRALQRVSEVVGGIRVSPDGRFFAFGQSMAAPPMSEFRSRLKICDFESLTCLDGPKYFEFTAGQATFWVER